MTYPKWPRAWSGLIGVPSAQIRTRMLGMGALRSWDKSQALKK